jgi:hypothetical protein
MKEDAISFLFQNGLVPSIATFTGSQFKISDFSEALNPNCNSSSRTLVFPNSNQFLDLNLDCNADLVLITEDGDGTRYIDIYLATSEGLCLAQEIPFTFDEGLEPSQISFGDFNFDGSPDMVYILTDTSSSSTPMEIHLVYNQLLTSPNSNSNSFCSKSKVPSVNNITAQSVPYNASLITSRTPSDYLNVYSLKNLTN